LKSHIIFLIFIGAGVGTFFCKIQVIDLKIKIEISYVNDENHSDTGKFIQNFLVMVSSHQANISIFVTFITTYTICCK